MDNYDFSDLVDNEPFILDKKPDIDLLYTRTARKMRKYIKDNPEHYEICDFFYEISTLLFLEERSREVYRGMTCALVILIAAIIITLVLKTNGMM